MHFNRLSFKYPWFFESSIPAWGCPHCGCGALALDQGSLKAVETPAAKRAFERSRNPDDYHAHFSCWLRCGSCGGCVVACGDAAAEPREDEDDPSGWVFDTAYQPYLLRPAPPLFLVPAAVPNDISVEIKRAFSLYWADYSACGNAIRIAVEALLTDIGIPRFASGRKRARLTLHARIEKLQNAEPDLARLCLAIKWLGNEASHPGGLSRDDVLDGFELLASVVEVRYSATRKEIVRVANQINRRKGPRARQHGGHSGQH